VDTVEPGQTPQDRLEIVVRVPKLKLKALLSDIIKKQMFGRVLGRIHLVEFLKSPESDHYPDRLLRIVSMLWRTCISLKGHLARPLVDVRK